MAHDGIGRRNLLFALAGGAAAAGGYAFYRAELAMPSDKWDELEHPEASLLDWPAAFGYTLVPLEDETHFGLWNGIWNALPAEKLDRLAEFRRKVAARPIRENLPRFEAAMGRMCSFPDHGFGEFLDLVYRRIFAHDAFLNLAYVDGAYHLGQADPYTLAQWGIPVPQASDLQR